MSLRVSKMPPQKDRPFFVKTPKGVKAHGKWFSKGDNFTWEEMAVPFDKVVRLYNQGVIHHNTDLEDKMERTIGDGLDALNIDQLHALRNKINDKVKKYARTTKEFQHKKCGFSKIPDKQRGKIRSWRRTYGEIETEE